MPNLTLAIEKEILKKARKIAVEKDTSVTQMVRTYIEQMVAKEEQGIETVIIELQRCFHAPDVVIGPKSWRREDLHER